MKNRIIKSGIIIAVVTLVMFNIQLLFDTSDSPILQGSTVSAFQTDPGINYYPLHKLDNINCWDVEVEFALVDLWGLVLPGIVVHIDSDGRRWACIRENQVIYCDVNKTTECKSVN